MAQVGATVKLDVTLKAPVKIGATLLVVGKIIEKAASKGGRNKVKITASLQEGESGSGPQVVFAEMQGLSIQGVRLSPVAQDHIDERTWLPCNATDDSQSGASEYRDSGWLMD